MVKDKVTIFVKVNIEYLGDSKFKIQAPYNVEISTTDVLLYLDGFNSFNEQIFEVGYTSSCSFPKDWLDNYLFKCKLQKAINYGI